MNLLLKIYDFLRGVPLTNDVTVGDKLNAAISRARAELINEHRVDDVHARNIKIAKMSADEDSLIINVLFSDELLAILRAESRLKPEAKITIYSNSKSFATNTTVMAVTTSGLVLRTRRGTMRENEKIYYSISNGGRLELHYMDALKNVVVGDDFGTSRSCAQYFDWTEYAYNWTYTGNIRSAIHDSCTRHLADKLES